jgi:hypothetical protein
VYTVTLSDIANGGNWYFYQGMANFARVDGEQRMSSAYMLEIVRVRLSRWARVFIRS